MKFPTLVLFSLISLLASVNLVAETGPHSGTVAETIDAGGYTYIRIEESETWIQPPRSRFQDKAMVSLSSRSQKATAHHRRPSRRVQPALLLPPKS
jgi:hypothetical protein